MRPVLLLCSSAALLQAAIVVGQLGDLYKHTFGVSDKAILATVINGDEAGKDALRFMLNYYKNLEANLTQQLARTEVLDKGRQKSVRNRILFSGWPKLNDNALSLYLPCQAARARKSEAEDR